MELPIKKFTAELCVKTNGINPKVLSESLSPDDIPPRNFIIKHKLNHETFCYEVECEVNSSKDLLTLLSILDEVSRLTELLKKCLLVVRYLRE